MRRHIGVAAVLTMLLVLSSASGALAGPHGSNRPWAGSAVGETWFDFEDNPKGCEVGFTTRAEEPAIASHFGAAFIVFSHCATYDPADNFVDSDFSLTAANGDGVFGTYWGTLDQYVEEVGEEGVFTLYLTLTGGEGRFEGATGSAVIKAHVIVEEDSSWPWWVTWEGMLTY